MVGGSPSSAARSVPPRLPPWAEAAPVSPITIALMSSTAPHRRITHPPPQNLRHENETRFEEGFGHPSTRRRQHDGVDSIATLELAGLCPCRQAEDESEAVFFGPPFQTHPLRTPSPPWLVGDQSLG